MSDLDAIIISNSGEDSVSGTNPLRLKLDGKIANIQVVLNYLKHQGNIVLPVEGDDIINWSSAPKLNGIYLLSYLTRHKIRAELINSYYKERDTFRNLLQHNPRVIIISTTFLYNKRSLRKLTDDIRSLAPGIFIIAGGPFVYSSYLMLQRSREQYFESEAAKDDFLFLNITNEPLVDLYIISRRGEHILCEALKKLKQNQAIDNLPNSAHLPGKSYSFTNQIDDTSNVLDNFIDWESLPDSIFESGVVPIQSSNGCPYKCAFCSFVKDRRLMFVKPMDELIDELKILSSRGVRYVWFVDENFRLGNSDLSSICQRFVDEDLNIKWMSYARASALKNIEAELLRRSGCIEVQLGLESADQQVLNSMNKQASSAIYAEVIQKLLAAGINCSCYFIFGFPGETDETALRTREFIKSIEHPELEGIFSWSIFPFILAPLSPIYEYETRKKYGLIGYMQKWKHKTMDSNQARKHVEKAFFDMGNSGTIYRGDNLDILAGLPKDTRKKFMASRHGLSKLAIRGRLEKQDIIQSFSAALQ
jgi:radical SAM superfamily enzyme YgiQ (UPF0313 family)